MDEQDYPDDEDDNDWEYPEPDEAEDDDAAELAECPKCGADLYEESERCPRCGEYITPKSKSLFATDRPWMIWAAILAILGIGGAWWFLL